MSQGNPGRFGSYGGHGHDRHGKGGSSGYADVSDYGRGGGWSGQGGEERSGIDYGAAANRDNQGYARSDAGPARRRFGGPRNYTRSDERIREDVCERLVQLARGGHLDPSDVEVTVASGLVTLAGTVGQLVWKHRAEDVAEVVSGVTEVDNRIRVVKQG